MHIRRIALLAGGGLLVLAGLCILTSVVNGTLSAQWMPWKVRESKTRGNEVVAALDVYRRDNGRYPKDLIELCPKYLTELPQPTAGSERWTYYSDNDGRSFNLAFTDRSASVPRCYYRPDLRRWVFKSF